MTAGKIKILHVVLSLNPGGMENGVVNLARHLSSENFEIHVCCLETAGEFACRLPEPKNIHILHKKPGFSPRTVWRLHQLIGQLHPHILHTHNLGPLIYGALASKMGYTCSLLHGEHSLLRTDEHSHRRLRQRRFFYRACAGIHTVSTELRDQLVKLGFPEDKISVLPNGVNTDVFFPGDRVTAQAEIGLPTDGAFTFGIVGRFGQFKGHSLLIEAFEKLNTPRPLPRLLIIGSGGPEEMTVRRRAASSPAANRIHFTGLQHQLAPYYRALDMLVSPSTNEGMSNAVLEAMACGLPVLANSACGNAEMISHDRSGWLSTMTSVDELVQQLSNALHSPAKLDALGQTARQSVLRNFSLRAMTSNYHKMYRQLGSASSRPC